MKLLYISCDHKVLEYQDLLIFEELGIDWFSTGLYFDPKNPISDGGFSLQPINKDNTELGEKFKATCRKQGINLPTIISKDFANEFDVIIANDVCPAPFAALTNWVNIKHKPVFWRTYGQTQPKVEKLLKTCYNQGLKVIRYSPKESNIENALPMDYLLRFWIDTDWFKGWDRQNDYVLTFNNFYARREFISNTNLYESIIYNLESKLYGYNPDNHPLVIGELSLKEQLQEYQNCAVYFSIGTKPGSYTLNLLEAMAVGCPTVTWGPKLGDTNQNGYYNVYEVPEIIENYSNGLASDDIKEIKNFIIKCKTDLDFSKKLSQNARKTILNKFSKEQAIKSWKAILNLN